MKTFTNRFRSITALAFSSLVLLMSASSANAQNYLTSWSSYYKWGSLTGEFGDIKQVSKDGGKIAFVAYEVEYPLSAPLSPESTQVYPTGYLLCTNKGANTYPPNGVQINYLYNIPGTVVWSGAAPLTKTKGTYSGSATIADDQVILENYDLLDAECSPGHDPAKYASTALLIYSDQTNSTTPEDVCTIANYDYYYIPDLATANYTWTADGGIQFDPRQYVLWNGGVYPDSGALDTIPGCPVLP